MSSEGSTEDVLAKLDALLKRHQPGAAQVEQKAHAEGTASPTISDDIAFSAAPEPGPEPAEAIPMLTDAIGESAIPVLTDVVRTEADILEQAEALHHLERQLVEQLEDRIASQLSATFDRALADLLESSRAYIEQAVHDALVRELGTEFDAPQDAKPADRL